MTLDPGRVAEAITPRTRAVVPVHWFGCPAAMDELLALAREHGLAVIEDCAHANGAVYRGRKAGTIGNMSCWSLQQSKVLTAAGEGGMLATNDEGLARTARSMCDHGKDKAAQPAGELEYSIVRVGNNYRLSEIQAAFAVAQLRKAAVVQEARKAHSEYLDSGLGQVPGLRRPSPPPDVRPGHPYYHRVADALDAEGGGTTKIAQEEFCPVHPLFKENCGPSVLPVAERVRRELLLLPLSRSDSLGPGRRDRRRQESDGGRRRFLQAQTRPSRRWRTRSRSEEAPFSSCPASTTSPPAAS